MFDVSACGDVREVYERVSQRLRVPEGELGPVEEMLLERVAWLYSWLRDRERRDAEHGVVADDRAYREMLSLWFQSAAQVQRFLKAEEKSSATEALKEQVLAVIGDVISQVLDDRLDPAEARAVKTALAEAFEQMDL